MAELVFFEFFNLSEEVIEKIEKFGEKWWGMLIIVGAPIFVVLSPVLFGVLNFGNPDSYRFQQLFYFYKDSILRGDSFFWNPYTFSGFPSFASFNGGFFNPLVYFGLKFFSVSFVYNWLNFIYLVLAAFFTAQFIKKIKISFWGQIIGGIIFVSSQWFLSFAIYASISFCLLPLLFLLIIEARQSDCLRSSFIILIGSLAIGLAWFSSFWHFLIEVLLAAGIFSLFCAFDDLLENKESKEKIRTFIKVPFSYLGMVLGGTAIGLFQLIPAFLFISLSPRVEQFTHWEAVSGGWHLYDLIAFVLPYFNYPFLVRSSQFINYWGVLALFLFIAAFSFRSTKKLIIFFSSFFVVSALLAINNSPVFWVIHHIPPFNLLHESGRWIILASFSASILAAFGLDALVENLGRLKSRLMLVITLFKWVGILIATASLISSVSYYFFRDNILSLANFYFDKFIYPRTSGLALDYYHNYLARLFSDFAFCLSPLNLRFLIPFFFLVSTFLFVSFCLAGRIPLKNLAALSGIIVIFNFVLVFSFDDNVYRGYFLNKEPETVEFINKQQGDKRVFSVFRFLIPISLGNYGAYGTRQEESELRSALLFSNYNVPFKVESVDFEGDPMTNRSMSKVITFIGGAASLPKSEKLENLPVSFEEKLIIFNSRKPVVDFLNIKYLLSTGLINEEIFPKVFESNVTDKKIPVRIYENKQARPLYYFSDEKWLIDLDENIAIDDLNKLLQNADSQINQEGLELIERDNVSLLLSSETSEEKVLVFSQNNLPGWQAYIDNERVPIKSVGTVFMGIIVPAGAHKINFQYSYWEIWRYFLANLWSHNKM